MIEAITRERWNQAQVAERKCHQLEVTAGFEHYRQAYANIFQYLGMETDQQGKTIIEVGPADFPALAYCENYQGVIIEPMPSESLEKFCEVNHIRLIPDPLEETVLAQVDEVWIFNVLQHVIDPNLFIAKCKSVAKVVRFFEPLDCEICVYHPHTFSFADFERWFGLVNRYTDRLEGFFDGDCCYGSWNA